MSMMPVRADDDTATIVVNILVVVFFCRNTPWLLCMPGSVEGWIAGYLAAVEKKSARRTFSALIPFPA